MSVGLPTRSLSDLDDQVRSGLRDYRADMEEAAANEDFAAMRNRVHLARRPGETARDYENRPKQFSRLTRRAIRTLTSHLYSPGPTRKAPDESLQAFLDAAYNANQINAVMQRADRKATLNGVAAIQVTPTGDPGAPVRLYLWGADEFVAFIDDADPLNPWAIAAKSIIDGSRPGKKRRKIELWSADEYRVYLSRDFDPHSPDAKESYGGTSLNLESSEPNPYGLIPFAYVFNELPVSRFGGEGIGSALREANQEVDRMLSDMAQLLEYYNRPLGFTRNVDPRWRYEDRIGRFSPLPTGNTDQLDSGLAPEVFFLQPEVNVESTWTHIRNLIDQTFTDLEIPLVAVEGRASAESGIAIVARNAPLLQYVKARQPAFTLYEQRLASLIVAVGSDGGMMPPEALTVEWPTPSLPLGTAEQDQSDAYEQDWGITSKVGLVMKRRGMTREQAIAYLDQLRADKDYEEAIFPPLVNQLMGMPADPNAPPDDTPPAQNEEPKNG